LLLTKTVKLPLDSQVLVVLLLLTRLLLSATDICGVVVIKIVL
jgi:hypothetical protein